MDKTFWETKITSIKENEIRIHGYRIDDLMGEKHLRKRHFFSLPGDCRKKRKGKCLSL